MAWRLSPPLVLDSHFICIPSTPSSNYYVYCPFDLYPLPPTTNTHLSKLSPIITRYRESPPISSSLRPRYALGIGFASMASSRVDSIHVYRRLQLLPTHTPYPKFHNCAISKGYATSTACHFILLGYPAKDSSQQLHSLSPYNHLHLWPALSICIRHIESSKFCKPSVYCQLVHLHSIAIIALHFTQ